MGRQKKLHFFSTFKRTYYTYSLLLLLRCLCRCWGETLTYSNATYSSCTSSHDSIFVMMIYVGEQVYCTRVCPSFVFLLSVSLCLFIMHFTLAGLLRKPNNITVDDDDGRIVSWIFSPFLVYTDTEEEYDEWASKETIAWVFKGICVCTSGS